MDKRDLEFIKYHMKEIIRLIGQDASEPLLIDLPAKFEGILNSSRFQTVKEPNFIPCSVLQVEQDHLRAVESILKEMSQNPAYSPEMKAGISKALQEKSKEYQQQMENLGLAKAEKAG